MLQTSHAPDERLDAALAILERLIGFDTESAKSNLGLVAFVEDYLKSLGVAYVKIPNAAGDKAALFASVGPSRDGGIVLSGTPTWFPWKVRPGQVTLSSCAARRTAFMAAAPVT